jgi:hypothetical protein
MTVRIGEMTSNVIAEPEAMPTAAAGSPAGDGDRWKRLEALRSAHSALVRLRMRTRAEAFDD